MYILHYVVHGGLREAGVHIRLTRVHTASGLSAIGNYSEVSKPPYRQKSPDEADNTHPLKAELRPLHFAALKSKPFQINFFPFKWLLDLGLSASKFEAESKTFSLLLSKMVLHSFPGTVQNI